MLEVARAVRQRRKHGLGAECRRERRVAGAEALAAGDDVGLDRQLVGGKPTAGASHPGHDLVEHDQEAVLRATLRKPLPERVRRCVPGECCGADRLAQECGDRLGAGRLQRPVELLERRLAGGVKAPGRRGYVRVSDQVIAVGLLQTAPPGQRERSHQRAVIGLGLRDDPPPLRLAAIDVVLAREPKRGLVRLRATGDEPNPRHLGRRRFDQSPRQPFLRLVGEVVVIEVRDPLRLLLRGGDDLGGAMAEARDHRAARAGVDDLEAVIGIEPDALTAGDHGVVEVEQPREDVGIGGGDGHRGVRLSLATAVSAIPATRSRKASNSRQAAARLCCARLAVSSSRRSGSTPSWSSSWR